MKKSLMIVFITVVLVVLISSTVWAAAAPAVVSGGWIGDGTTVKIDTSGANLPNWLMLLDSNGITVTGSQQICHAFPGGQYGWMADIRVQNGSEWVSVPTTQGWYPDEEGMYRACANVSGWKSTYALFGYYIPPVTKSTFNEEVCQYDDWEIYSWWHNDYYPWEEGYSLEVYLGPEGDFPLGETVTYEILGEYPIPGFDIPQTGTTISWDDGAIYATFTDYVYDELPDPSFTRLVKVSTAGCVHTLLWDSDDSYED